MFSIARFSLLFLVSLTLFFACPVVSTGQIRHPVLAENFERRNSSEIYKRLTSHSLLEVVEKEGVGGGRALKATYEGYEQGSKRMVVRVPLEKRGEEMTLCYDVKFDEDFQFVKGGKLLGLGPENAIAGGKAMKPEGWSARVNFGREGAVRTYLYVQNKPGKYGAGKAHSRFRFEKGRYHAVSLHVKLNESPKTASGFARIYVDGKLMVDHRDLEFRGVDGEETLISHFLFSTFHGGSGADWAPKNSAGEYATVHAFFDNIAIYEGEKIRKKPGADWRD